MKKTLLMALACCLLGPTAHAQGVYPQRSDGGGKGVDTTKVYDVVEQMPALPGGAGTYAVVAAIQRAIILPAGENVGGRVFVSFIVGRKGKIRDAKVLQTPSPALGKAVLAAVAKLPQFKPGMQNGETTNVRFQVPILLNPQP